MTTVDIRKLFDDAGNAGRLSSTEWKAGLALVDVVEAALGLREGVPSYVRLGQALARVEALKP